MSAELPIARDLDAKEQAWLLQGSALSDALHQRYMPLAGEHHTPESMDAVYRAWCEDQRRDLPALQDIYQGFGYRLGELFRDRFAYEWKMVTSEFGSEISLFMSVASSVHRNAVLSPLSMVAKRVRDGRPFFVDLFYTIIGELEGLGYAKKKA